MRSVRWRSSLVAAHDALAACVLFLVAVWLRNLSLPEPATLQETLSQPVWRIAIVAAAGLAGALILQRTSFWRPAAFGPPVTRLGLAALVTTVLWTSALFAIDRLHDVPRSTPLIFAPLYALYLIASREAADLVRRFLRKGPARHSSDFRAQNSLLLIGTADGVHALLTLMRLSPEGGTASFAGILLTGPERSAYLDGVPVLGDLSALESVLARLDAERRPPAIVYIAAKPSDLDDNERGMIAKASAVWGFETIDVVDALGTQLWPQLRIAADEAHFQTSPDVALPSAFTLGVKRVIDMTVSAGGLVVLSPLILLVALLVRLNLGAPIFFVQTRSGIHLRPVRLFKFRTMHFRTDHQGRLLPDHARASLLGTWLRRLHLDELPQLLNVLSGELSLVGPRPLVDRDVEALPDRGRLRACVRPGMTGWAQIHGGQSVSPRDKLLLDMYYVKHMSLWFDFKILLRTAIKMVRGDLPNPRAVEIALSDVGGLIAREDARFSAEIMRLQPRGGLNPAARRQTG